MTPGDRPPMPPAPTAPSPFARATLANAAVGTGRLARLLGDWANGPTSLPTQLAGHVQDLVRTGSLPPGSRLPSERSLAAVLSVSRNTVGRAFDLLRGDGVLTSRQGAGTYVSVAGRRTGPHGDDRLQSFVDTAAGLRPRIDLRSAALPGLALVADHLDGLDRERLRGLIATHGYLPRGLPELRAAISRYYADLGLPTRDDQILVTSGAQQALRLAAGALVGPGDVVLVEEPSFRGMLESTQALGARLVGVPMTADGLDVDAFTRCVARYAPRLALVQSTVHNPTGAVMTPMRRRALAALAGEHGLPFVDDTTMADTVVDGDRRPVPLAAYGGPIVTVGSVSKSFWGGLRVGWLRADPDLVAHLTGAKSGEDLGTSVLAQELAARLLTRIDEARDRRHEDLRATRGRVLDALTTLLPDWRPLVPAGGASIWVRLPYACGTAFAQFAERRGVRLLPGPTFSHADELDDAIRISFASGADPTLAGVRLLATAWRDFHRSRPAPPP